MHRAKETLEGFQEWQPTFTRSHICTVGSPIATKQAETYQESVRNSATFACLAGGAAGGEGGVCVAASHWALTTVILCHHCSLSSAHKGRPEEGIAGD